MYHRNIIETEIANALKPYQGKVLYSFDMDVAFKGKRIKFLTLKFIRYLVINHIWRKVV